MNKARLIITALHIENLTQQEAATRYGVSQSWVSKLVTRYKKEGEAAFHPRSKRPHTSTTQLGNEVIQLILTLRQELSQQGHDAGAHTIAWHLHTHHNHTVHPATIWRYLKKHGLITAQPQKRPKSSYIRFEASLPNETWQSDFTHYRLTTGHTTGVVTFRHAGKLHHIGIGRPYKNTKIIMLIDGLNIRVVDQKTGELIRELTLDTTKDYQAQTQRNTPKP